VAVEVVVVVDVVDVVALDLAGRLGVILSIS
jgi:hypothetical protein